MSIKGLLIGILAIIGLGVLGNAILSGGSVDAHGGDDSVLHVCVGKWGSLRAAYVVSPNGNCPSALFDQVHLEVADETVPVAKTCPAGSYMTGIEADGSLTCGAFEDLFYYVVEPFNGVGSGTAVCDAGDVAVAGSFVVSADAKVVASAPGDGGLVADPLHKDKWTVSADANAGLIYSIAVCLDIAP